MHTDVSFVLFDETQYEQSNMTCFYKDGERLTLNV